MVFCHVVERKSQKPETSGYYEVIQISSGLYNMHIDKGVDKRINKLLSGLSSIVDAIILSLLKNLWPVSDFLMDRLPVKNISIPP